MELAEAINRRLPFHVRLPSRRNPLGLVARCVAEVFLVETTRGPAVVWLDPFWCRESPTDSCHIAYVSPRYEPDRLRWIDDDPRYGPGCLAYQKPFVMEQLDRRSPAWREWEEWQRWRDHATVRCGRNAAWERVRAVFGALILSRAAGVEDGVPSPAPAVEE